MKALDRGVDTEGTGKGGFRGSRVGKFYVFGVQPGGAGGALDHATRVNGRRADAADGVVSRAGIQLDVTGEDKADEKERGGLAGAEWRGGAHSGSMAAAPRQGAALVAAGRGSSGVGNGEIVERFRL